MKDFEYNEARKKEGFFPSLRCILSEEAEKRKNTPSVLLLDIGVLFLGVLFSRCHIVFGARPLAIGLLALLPSRVLTALLGAVIGAMTLGSTGAVYAIIYTLLVALRIIISGAGTNGECAVFGEGLLLRLCEGTLAGFIALAYQLLLSGITVSNVLFGVSMLLIPPLVTFALSGIFDTNISFPEFFSGKGDILSIKGRGEREKFALLFFQCSLLILSLLITISLSEFDVFGFSIAAIYVGIATVFVAKRFGAIRGAAVGFVSAFPLSSGFSVAFALAGLGAGTVFSFGLGWGIAAGAAALVAWSAYTGGAMEILNTLPEYTVGSAIVAPIVKRTKKASDEKLEKSPSDDADDMVNTLSLSYRGRKTLSQSSLEEALFCISTIAKDFSAGSSIREEEYLNLIMNTVDEYNAFGGDLVKRIYIDKAPVIAAKLKRGEAFTASMLGVPPDKELYAEELEGLIYAKKAKLEEERYKQSVASGEYEDYKLISKLLSESRESEESERELNTALRDSIYDIFSEIGAEGCSVKVFGERRLHIIAACEDRDGSLITSPKIKEGIERLSSVSLGKLEYFRRGNTALLEAEATRRYEVECAEATIAGASGEISGDVSVRFTSDNDYFYSLISDGMGSGEVARETAEFVAKFLSSTLKRGPFCDTILDVANNIIRRRGEESSVTVDLLEFDLICGKGVFIKSGAAPSYIKRDSSIFRIRSKTAPIGLMKTTDSERVNAEIKLGDYIIMLSDGVVSTPDDESWLLEILNEPPRRNIKEYAEYILSAAVKYSRTGDDMTVLVAKIKEKEDVAV